MNQSLSTLSKQEIERAAETLTAWARDKSSAVRLQASMVVVQLHSYASGNEKHRAVLTPGIAHSFQLLAQARCGR